MARTGDTTASFATAVLVGLAKKTGNPYPVTASNLAWIESWVNREGGGGANNPLNTTYVTDTSTLLQGNSAGVRNYASLDDGVNATVATLVNGNYPNILSALRSGNAQAADQAGQLSKDLLTWSGGINSDGSRKVNAKTGQPEGYNSLTGTSATPGSALGTGEAGSATATFQSWLAATEPGLESLAKDPEVGPLLLQFYTNGTAWADQFQQQLTQTQWWKNTPADQRQQLVDSAQDPGTLAQGLSNKQNYISTQATQMGVDLTSAQVSALAEQWQGNSGWSSDQITQAIAAHAPTAQTATKGSAATDVNALNALYKSYQVPVTPQTLQQQYQQVLAGTQTIEGITSTVAQQAKQLYSYNPQLAAAIDDKNPTMSVIQPLIAQAANQLGVDQSTIDPSNPKWSFLLKPSTDAKGESTGNQINLDDLNRQIQTNPIYGYSKTANGIAAYTNMADALSNAFSGGAKVQ